MVRRGCPVAGSPERAPTATEGVSAAGVGVGVEAVGETGDREIGGSVRAPSGLANHFDSMIIPAINPMTSMPT